MRKLLAMAGTLFAALSLLSAPAVAAPPGPTPPQYPSPAGDFRVHSDNGIVRVREAPSTDARIVARIPSGRKVTVLCTVTGGSPIRARGGQVSRVWDRTPQGWISDVLVKTGTFKPLQPGCPLYDAQMYRADQQAQDLALMEDMRLLAPYLPNEYHYHYRLALGPRDPASRGITPERVVDDLYRDFDRLFQFRGCGPEVWRGKTCSLDVYGADSPVHFASVRSRQFSFISLLGHPEGELRAITFKFEVSDRKLYVDIRATGPARSWLTTNPTGKQINGITVWRSWNDFARDLGAHYGLR